MMHLDDRKISVSLATMELKAEGGKTTLKVSEQEDSTATTTRALESRALATSSMRLAHR